MTKDSITNQSPLFNPQKLTQNDLGPFPSNITLLRAHLNNKLIPRTRWQISHLSYGFMMNFIIASGPGQDTVVCVDSGPPPPSLSVSCLENASFAVCSFGLWLWHRQGSPLSIHMTQRGQQHRKGVRTPPRDTHLRNAVRNEQKRNIHHSGVPNKSFNKSVGVAGRHCMCVCLCHRMCEWLEFPTMKTLVDSRCVVFIVCDYGEGK